MAVSLRRPTVDDINPALPIIRNITIISIVLGVLKVMQDLDHQQYLQQIKSRKSSMLRL